MFELDFILYDSQHGCYATKKVHNNEAIYTYPVESGYNQQISKTRLITYDMRLDILHMIMKGTSNHCRFVRSEGWISRL